MIRLYLPFSLVLLFLVVPKESAAQSGNLAEMSEVAVVVLRGLTKGITQVLNEREITNLALVLLRSKMPRLLVKDSADSIVLIFVNIAPTATTTNPVTGHFGFVSVGVQDNVTIVRTGKIGRGYLWYNIQEFSGSTSDINNNIREALDRLITRLAADWYRDNPAK